MQQQHHGTRRSPYAYEEDEPHGSPASRRYAGDLDKPRGSVGLRLIRRFASSTVVILSLVVVAAVVFVANFDFGGKGTPPPGTSNMSTNELMQEMSGYQMNPVVANAEAQAKQRAYDQQVAIERAAAKKAKLKAKLLAQKKAWEALKKKMSSNPSAAENQAYAKMMNAKRGWGGCWSSLLTMWNHESGWNEHATNPGSGAYGIPQALPGSKMASAGPDWQNNAMTQISWGLGYVGARYGDPCKAWSFWQAHHWY